MQHEAEHDPAIKAFEAALANLTPTHAAFNRDRVLFEAGSHSQRSRWLWPITAFCSWLALSGLALAWWLSVPMIQERIVYVPISETEPTTLVLQQPEPSSDEPSYLRLREDILENKWPQLPVIVLDHEAPQPPTTAASKLIHDLNAENTLFNWPLPRGFRP